MPYIPVDLTTPWLVYWGALVLVVVGGTLLALGIGRGRRHRAEAARAGRHAEVRVLEDARLQRRLGAAVLVAGLVAVGVGAWRHVEGLHAFEANVRTKYGVDHVERVRQSGSGLTADLVHPDGTVERDVYLALDPTGEPFHGEDLALGTPGPRG